MKDHTHTIDYENNTNQQVQVCKVNITECKEILNLGRRRVQYVLISESTAKAELYFFHYVSHGLN